ncbi:MAG: hypothetical protein C4532_07405 [Candidatus Abyssobacteria bacterium SURF_17]|uniref:Protein kinase domain-containing protein n=1 Tax=Candidatus Abyssobacteria bacterium SURF_17 TaxID=2093361 RepID=A0A419F0M5_9BACT|nr:MAG: hypothetical protein C4532_07405 [Candidatus Abyssubacteria bacterium SURF_17]
MRNGPAIPQAPEGGVSLFECGQWIDDQYLVIERHRSAWWVLYAVYDRISEKVFLVKRPIDALIPNASATLRLINNAKAWIGLGDCDEVANAYLVKEFARIPYIFIEYIHGPSLADIFNDAPEKPLPEEQTVGLMKQLIKGMKFLHDAPLPDGNTGAIHGNLCPRNILTKAGSIKITDIGLMSALRQSVESATAELLRDAISYMAPEQREQPGRADKLTDIYSFGAIMYEAATGMPPLPGGKASDPLGDLMQIEPLPPKMRNRSCPRWLEETILKCIARRPENRFQSFAQIDVFLKEMIEAEETSKNRSEKREDRPPTSRVARIRGMAKRESRHLEHYYLGVEHLMLGLIAEEEDMVMNCFDRKVSAEQLRSEILAHLPKGEGPWYWEGVRKTPRYERIAEQARAIRREYGHDRMLPQHILLALLEEGSSVPVRILKNLKVDVKAAAQNLRRELARTRSAVFVYKTESPLSRFADKLPCTTALAPPIPFVDRTSELSRARELIQEDGKSLLVVGEPGVGKTAFLNALECLLSEAAASASRDFGGLHKLRVGALIAASEDGEQFDSNLLETIGGVIESHSVLVIEDLPVVLDVRGKVTPGRMADTLEEYVASKGLMLVATATPAGYVAGESACRTLIQCLEIINLPEAEGEQALEMLAASKEVLEKEHSVRIVDEALEATIRHSRAVSNRALPGKAFDLLEHACITARFGSYVHGMTESKPIITADQVAHALAETQNTARELPTER